MAIGASQTHRETVPAEASSRAVSPRSRQRRTAHLVTADDALWPQFGAVVSSDVVLTQVDDIKQLLTLIEPGYAGIVIWDARADADFADQLARMQLHSPRLAIIVLDSAAPRSLWARLAEQNQIVSLLGLPLSAEILDEAINRAADEVQTRSTLLGNQETKAAARTELTKRTGMPALAGAGVLALILAVAFGTYVVKHSSAPQQTAPASPSVTTAPVPGAAAPSPAAPAARTGSDDPVDALLEKATQAMLERRYIEPLDNSALGYYRSVLGYDADNAEAKQGLDRLEGLLVGKAQAALDQQHFEPALQALEIARSINRDDPRLQAVDSRLSKMRSELGSTAIQAAINAGNYDRAAALLDEAAQAKAFSSQQIAQLRSDITRRRDESDEDRLIKTAEARIQQDRLIEPAGDSAAHWFALAKKSGSSSPALTAAIHDFAQRLVQAARTALEQNRLVDADRLMNEAKQYDAPPAAVADLQRDIAAARSLQGRQKNEEQHAVDLIKARTAQGNLLEPDQDSALFYLNSLKALDPQNAALPDLSHTLQGAIVAHAGSLFDQGLTAEAQSALQSALKLGNSADAGALADKIARASVAPARATAELKLLKPIAPKYPPEAAARGTEGWVDLTLTVLPNGHTSALRVTGSSPRKVFDQTALEAVYSARYEPIPKDQPQIARDTKIRVTFKLGR